MNRDGDFEQDIDIWRKQIPAEAQGLLNRCAQLVQRIAASKGFNVDPSEPERIRQEFQALKQDIAAVTELHMLIQRTRGAVNELMEEPPINVVVSNTIREFGEEWTALLNHIVRVVSDRKGAAPAIAQVKQVKDWTRQKRQAATLIRSVVELKSKAEGVGPSVLAGVEETWSKEFRQGDVDQDWFEERLRRLEGFQKEFEPPSVTGQMEAEENLTEEVEEDPMTSFYISETLSECRDLTIALHLDGEEIRRFEQQRWDLQGDQNASSNKALLREINLFHQGLLDRASEEKETRLQGLRMRWNRFQEIYDDGPYKETRELVDIAERALPDSTIGMDQFFERVNEAMNKIYFTVDSNRPRMTSAIRRTAELCRTAVSELRSQPRFLLLDSKLTQQEKNIPADGGLPTDAEQSFVCLERCDTVRSQLQLLKQENAQELDKVTAKREHLRSMISAISTVANEEEKEEVKRLTETIGLTVPASEWLDHLTDLLSRTEKRLRTLTEQAKEGCTAEVSRMRRENTNWIHLLMEVNPEAEMTINKEPPPLELEELRGALEMETLQRQRIRIMASAAVEQVNARRSKVCLQLREHLAKSSFEMHPERARADELVEQVECMPPLPSEPSQADFSEFFEVIADAEAFIERLDRVRRLIPALVQGLEERLARLNELDAASFHRPAANRVKVLLQGIRAAIVRDHFEHLRFQVEEAEKLIKALETDVGRRVSTETEERQDRLSKAHRASKDPQFTRQAEAVLALLEENGQLQAPPHPLRRRLNRLLGWSVGNR